MSEQESRGEPKFPNNQESRPTLGRAVIIMGFAIMLLVVSVIVTVLKARQPGPPRPDYTRDSMDQGEKQEPSQLTDLMALWTCHCEPEEGKRPVWSVVYMRDFDPPEGCYCFGVAAHYSAGETWRLGTDVGRRCPEGLIFTLDLETGVNVCAERANRRAEAMNVDEE